ncbi:MAG: DUF2971 domain-containing protein [Bacteroidaceae bacterium]|nr:DUF2971 domain-containing protein [Bacteroidaceae bacterium]
MAQIYHYTSIETLALILTHKTIRFNRLDQVDDIEESLYGSGQPNLNMGQYQFVSCWTKDKTENLSLWKMYTDYKGVRIGMDENMFIGYKVNSVFQSFFSEWFKIIDDCMFLWPLNEIRLYDIQYVNNYEKKIKSLIKTKGDEISFNPQEFGIYKNKEWEFQKESRFKLMASPLDPDLCKKIKTDSTYHHVLGLINTFIPSLLNNYKIKTTYIDMPLNSKVLNEIEIMMGPQTSEAEKYIVGALLQPYTKAIIIDSKFKGKIRKK